MPGSRGYPSVVHVVHVGVAGSSSLSSGRGFSWLRLFLGASSAVCATCVIRTVLVLGTLVWLYRSSSTEEVEKEVKK